MFRVGLTGGIASGKTAVTRLFAECGAGIVDTDVIARDVVLPGTPGLDAIVGEFGAKVLDSRGELDRAAMRRHIFANASARERLEAIVHPLIRQKTLELMEATMAPYVIVAVPLLIETDFGRFVDRILVVDCSVELQIERLVRRDGVTADEAHRALAAQTSRESRLAAADDVIDNSGTFDELAVQVERLHTCYLNMAADCPEPTGRAE